MAGEWHRAVIEMGMAYSGQLEADAVGQLRNVVEHLGGLAVSLRELPKALDPQQAQGAR